MEATALVLLFLMGFFVGLALRPSFDEMWDSAKGEGVPFIPFI
jgi:hypothetical protein